MINSFGSASTAVTAIVGGTVSEYLIQKNLLTRTNTRKLFSCIAAFGASICYFLIPIAGCDETWVVTLIIVSQLFFGLTTGGDTPLATELTTNFVGSLYGNTLLHF